MGKVIRRASYAKSLEGLEVCMSYSHNILLLCLYNYSAYLLGVSANIL